MLQFEGEGRWLAVMALTALAELVWWVVSWSRGIAPAPFLGTYLVFAGVGLGGACAMRLVAGKPAMHARWPIVLLGTLLVVIGASLFLPLKFAIPRQLPFWFDGSLASAERAVLGRDAWALLDPVLGPAIRPIDWLYGLWVPVQALVLFVVMLGPPSPAKSRVLIAYALAWFVLGVAAAALFSSAGPIFYDRVFGGDRFAALTDMLHRRGAWVVLAESDAMWASHLAPRPGLVAGISAFPSLHVAISLWIYFAARETAPRAAPIALGYFMFMWIASVQLGWHYVSDGLGALIGMLLLWALAAWLDRKLTSINAARGESDAQVVPATLSRPARVDLHL
ncbi:MAG: phosphatase PAP2 family protein [Sphingomicrobium sp.]